MLFVPYAGWAVSASHITAARRLDTLAALVHPADTVRGGYP